MQPNYEFIGLNATRLYHNLDRLRSSAEFRAIEASVSQKYDRVIVIMAEKVIPFKTL